MADKHLRIDYQVVVGAARRQEPQGRCRLDRGDRHSDLRDEHRLEPPVDDHSRERRRRYPGRQAGIVGRLHDAERPASGSWCVRPARGCEGGTHRRRRPDQQDDEGDGEGPGQLRAGSAWRIPAPPSPPRSPRARCPRAGTRPPPARSARPGCRSRPARSSSRAHTSRACKEAVAEANGLADAVRVSTVTKSG